MSPLAYFPTVFRPWLIKIARRGFAVSDSTYRGKLIIELSESHKGRFQLVVRDTSKARQMDDVSDTLTIMYTSSLSKVQSVWL